MKTHALYTFFAALTLSACIGATEGELSSFEARAAGPIDAHGGPLTFVNARGFRISLEQASVRVSALRFNEQARISSERESSCIKDSLYVAEVNAPLTIDLLDGDPIAFPVEGTGLHARARMAEVWLSGNGDINADEDRQPIFTFRGQVTRADGSHALSGTVTIGKNRKKPPLSEVQPGSNSICSERIVTGIPVDWIPRADTRLLLRVDPRTIFADVDFDGLEPASDGSLAIPDDNSTPASRATYDGLHRIRGVYSFSFE